MRHFRCDWLIAKAVNTAFILAILSMQMSLAADIGMISPTNFSSHETGETVFFAYNNFNKLDADQECCDGDYYYQQKYAAAAPSYVYQYEEVEEDEAPAITEAERGEYAYQYAVPFELYGTSVIPSLDLFSGAAENDGLWAEIDEYPDEKFSGSPYVADYTCESGCCLYDCDMDESLALFTWDPEELLTWSDQETLRLLATLLEDDTSGTRRAVLNDYIESLGSEAAELSIRFAEASGLAVPSLSDDLPQTAAFIACYRLVEKGELSADEALLLLQKSLSHRSNQWNCWVDEVTGETEKTKAQASFQPVLKAVMLTAANSLESLGQAISGVSHQIKKLY